MTRTAKIANCNFVTNSKTFLNLSLKIGQVMINHYRTYKKGAG